MTVLQKLSPYGGGSAEKRWYRFGHGAEAVRHTDAWEHENFEEEQARWERSDPQYARICDAVRRARLQGGEALRDADEAKADWDVRVAARRQASDDADATHHATQAKWTEKE